MLAALSIVGAISALALAGVLILVAGLDKLWVVPITGIATVLLLLIGHGRPVHFMYGLAFFNIAFLAVYFPLFGHLLSIGGLVDKSTMTWVVGIRSATLVAAMAVFLVLYRHSIDRKQKVMLVVILISLTLFFLRSDQALLLRLIYLLNSLLPLLLCLYMLRICLTSSSTLPNGNTGQRSHMAFMIACVVVGCVYWVNLDTLYDIFRPDLISSARTPKGTALEYGSYPRSWHSKIGSFSFTRMTGTFPDPIQWGYVSAFFTFVYVVLRPKPGLYLAPFLLALIILSGSKGAFLLLASASVLFLLHYFYCRYYRLGACILYTLILAYATVSDSSVKYHLQGLFSGISAMLNAPIADTTFGHGLGSGGNFSILSATQTDLDLRAWHERGSESGLGVLAYQTGLLGIALCVYLLRQLHREVDNTCIEHYYKSALHALTTAYLINFTLQENLLNSSFLLLLVLSFLKIVASGQAPEPASFTSWARLIRRSA